jgi:hypothetical protein
MKVERWPERLQLVLDDAAGRRFEWGSSDCCEFVARCAQAVTGLDFRSAFPPYHSEAEAQALLEQHGGIRGLLCAAFGEARPREDASGGDIVLVDMGNGEQPAICLGAKCAAPGAKGLVTHPVFGARCSWVL